MMDSLLKARSGRWTLFVLGWAALSLLFAPETYLSFYLRSAPISWVQTLQMTVLNSAIALLFIPGIVYLTRRCPLERRSWHRAVLIHVPACLAFSIGHSGLYALACATWSDVGGTMFFRFHPNLLTYWAVVGFTQAFDYFRKYQQHERALARLQLEVLKAQLQPHFLFNALHAISAMMHVDLKRADRMLNRLSELFRMMLSSIGKDEVRLAEEIAFVQAYLDIERERFGGALALHIAAPAEALDALVPALFLQPLVENCVRHGFRPGEAEGSIWIEAARIDSHLVLTVTDDGRGLPSGPSLKEGIGVTNSRKRLAQLYGEDQDFSIAARSPRGTTVRARIPYRSALEVAHATGETSNEHPSADRGRRAMGAHANRYAAER